MSASLPQLIHPANRGSAGEQRLVGPTVSKRLFIALVAMSVVAATLSVRTAPDVGAQSARYQSNVVRVDLAGETLGAVHNVDVDIRFRVGGCNDPDTCVNGKRLNRGYTWFLALAVELGDTTQPREVEFQLHGGLAKGGTGASNRWYADWSGYYGPDHPSEGVLPGGSQQRLSIEPGDWVRLRIWRVDAARCRAGEWGWFFSVTNIGRNQEAPVGTMCLTANTITGAYYFTEVIEDDPCRTDLAWVMSKNFRYRDERNRAIAPSRAVSLYSDDTCNNTKLFVGHSKDRSNLTRRLVVDRRNLRRPRDIDSGAVLWGIS